MPTAKRAPDKAPEETTPPAEDTQAPVLDPALVERYDLPDDYVERVNAGLEPHPPRVGDDEGAELHFEGGAWVHTLPGQKPGDTTAITRL